MKFGVVIVVYQKKITDLPMLSSLEKLSRNGYPVLCYDNSPLEQIDYPKNANFFYYHDEKNSGVTAGYNMALSKFAGDGLEGILLLDQDSQFEENYFTMIVGSEFKNNVVALIPQVFAGDQQISPVDATHYINRNSKMIGTGVAETPVMAINSGAVVSIVFMQEIGGFNPLFQLDFSDHWLFAEIYRRQKIVDVLPIKLQHELSVLDYTTLSATRYTSILRAENIFYQKYAPQFLTAHQKQLFKRIIKQRFIVKRPDLAKITRVELRQLKKGGTV